MSVSIVWNAVQYIKAFPCLTVDVQLLAVTIQSVVCSIIVTFYGMRDVLAIQFSICKHICVVAA